MTPDGAHRRQDGEALPQLAVEAGPRISSSTMASAWRRISARSGVTAPMMRTPRPGPGNGWRQTMSCGQAELLADGSDLVLEQAAQRLDQVEGEVLGQAAHVVMGLDVGRGVAPRLDDVGVQGALDQELRPRAGTALGRAQVARHLFEDPDEQLADDLALALGIGHAGQCGEVAVGSLHVDQVDVELAAEGVLDLVGLARSA